MEILASSTMSTSFIIDVAPLKCSAKKPRHLESRWSAMKKQGSHHVKHLNKHAKRNAFLEARRKACADNVAKAKAIARRHATRLQEETASKKAAIALKLSQSEARRMRLMNVPRSKLLDPASLKDPIEDAAKNIQIWWRSAKVTKCARLYQKLGLSIASAKNMPFARLVKLSQSEAVVKGVGRLLVRAKRLSTTPVENWKAPTKVFLSSYMMVAHPEEIMSVIGPDEEHMCQRAEEMLTTFEEWMNRSKSADVTVLGRKFLASWVLFYDTFTHWKTMDTPKLAADLINHFMDLEKLWNSVKEQEDAENEWKPQMKAQQKQILNKLTRIGPSALESLFNTRSAALNENLNATESIQTRPVTMTNTSPDVYPCTVLPRRDSVTHSRHSSGTSETEAKSTKQAQMTSNDVPALESVWSNQKLAHELVMDPDFKMKRSDASTLEGQISAIARKAFFDSIRSDFEQGNFTAHVPALIKDIRDMLIAMLPEKSKVGLEINEVLDIDLISQQLVNNAFDIRKCLEYVTGKMLQLCAPVRDASIRAIAGETDLTNAFERILIILEDMKFDLMNYQLQGIKPVLVQQAVEYESSKFDAALAKGEVSLTKTTEWLRKSVADLLSTSAARNPENLTHPDLKVRYESAYHDALMGLIFSTSPLDENAIAETLALDVERIFAMQNEAQAIGIIAALSMLSKNIVPELRNDASAVTELKKALFILLEAKDTTVENLAIQIISTTNASLEKSKKTLKLSSDQETVIRNMVDKTLSFTDPVYSLITRRMQVNIRHQMEKGLFKKESLASHGLDTVADELESLSRRICLLAKHNKEVYVKHYDSILSALIQ